MKTIKMLLLSAVSAGALVGASARALDDDTPDPAAQELMRLQGTWNAIGYQFAGKSRPKEKIQALKCVVNGNRVTHQRLGKVEGQFTFSVDPSKMPHQIDQTSNGQTYHGIYRLTQNTFTVCLPTDPGAPRPDQFATKAGDGQVLRIYRKAEDQPSASPGTNTPAR